MNVFLRLGKTGRLGAGECAAIAVALHRSYTLAIDDLRALRRAIREAGLSGQSLQTIGTRDIVVSLIHAGILTVSDADDIGDAWANCHRFRLRIVTFGDLV